MIIYHVLQRYYVNWHSPESWTVVEGGGALLVWCTSDCLCKPTNVNISPGNLIHSVPINPENFLQLFH